MGKQDSWLERDDPCSILCFSCDQLNQKMSESAHYGLPRRVQVKAEVFAEKEAILLFTFANLNHVRPRVDLGNETTRESFSCFVHEIFELFHNSYISN